MLAICCKQLTNSTHGTGGLNALRGSTPLPSLRKARASLSASTFNCGIRVQSNLANQLAGPTCLCASFARAQRGKWDGLGSASRAESAMRPI